MVDNRKVIKFGKTSFVVSLPIKWLRKYGLDKGDLLDVKENSHNLIIAPLYQEKAPREHVIVLEKEADFLSLMNRIKSAYLSNYDIIRIKGTNLTKQYSNITKILKSMNALDLISISDNEITMRDYLNKANANTKDIFLKLNTTLNSMFESLLSNENFESISNTDLEINKYCNFLGKIINHKMNARSDNAESLMIINKISNYIELIGDEIKRIAKTNAVKDLNKDALKKIHEHYKQCFDSAAKLLNKEHIDTDPLVKRKEYLSDSLEAELKKTDSKLVAASLPRLKNIIEFSHIIMMSAQVYALM